MYYINAMIIDLFEYTSNPVPHSLFSKYCLVIKLYIPVVFYLKLLIPLFELKIKTKTCSVRIRRIII